MTFKTFNYPDSKLKRVNTKFNMFMWVDSIRGRSNSDPSK